MTWSKTGEENVVKLWDSVDSNANIFPRGDPNTLQRVKPTLVISPWAGSSGDGTFETNRVPFVVSDDMRESASWWLAFLGQG